MGRFINKLWLGLGFVALAMLLLVGNLASGQTTPPRGDTVVLNGYINCGPLNETTRVCPFRLHYMEFTEGRTYMIRMDSSDFGSRLVLEDMQGRMLACDDDWFDGLDGTIVFRPTATGTYRMIANASTAVEGFYTITVREVPIVMNVEASLVTNDEMPGNFNEMVYEVAMTAGRRYVIDMVSNEFDAFVRVLNREGAIVAFTNECDRMHNTRVVFTPTETGVYRIGATSNAEHATGGFRLMVVAAD